MITNENDFLGLLISNADDKHNCNAWTIVKKSELQDIDCLSFLKSLEAKELIKMTSTTNIHIYPQGYEAYVSTPKKAKKLILKSSEFTLNKILEVIIGVIIAVVTAGILIYLGWN